MNLRICIAAAAAALALCAVGPGLAQVPAQAATDPLPDGPGKDAVVRVCTQCHDATQFAYARYTPEGWDNEIAKMQSAGALMTADEQLAISAYLAKYLSPSARPEPTPVAPVSPPAQPRPLAPLVPVPPQATTGIPERPIPKIQAPPPPLPPSS